MARAMNKFDIPFQITFRNMNESDFIWIAVQERVDHLAKFYQGILLCEVVISEPHRSRRKGNLFHVTIRLHIPGNDIFISREPEKTERHMDPYVAIGDAFDAAERQLEDRVRVRRGFVKQRLGPAHGKIARIFPERGYGFIETPDGREVYFHENSILGKSFDRLDVGEEVHFSEEMGEQGPQVTSMRIVKHANRHARPA